jgi:putative transposase
MAQLPDPLGFRADPFADLVRGDACRLADQAIPAEPAALVAAFPGKTLEHGPSRLVRHACLPEREVRSGIGPVPVKEPRVRDRKPGESKITFTSPILPRSLRKARPVEDLLLALPQGVSTRDPGEALAALPGPNAQGLFARTVPRRDKRTGGTTVRPGRHATRAIGAFSAPGRTGWIPDRAWLREGDALWGSSGPMKRAARSVWR